MSAEVQDRVITHGGSEYCICGRAWWLSSALDKGDGRIDVARISAQSTTLRKPSAEQLSADPTLNRYWVDERNEGELAEYVLGLTDEDLEMLGITPGKLVYPDVVDCPRPPTNRTDRPISMRQSQQEQDWLQNDCIGKPGDY